MILQTLRIAIETLAVSKIGTASQLGIPKTDATASTITSTMNVVYLVAGVVAVIIIIIAGITYSTSVGDPGKTKKARDAIIYSLVGLIIITCAYGIMNFVVGRF